MKITYIGENNTGLIGFLTLLRHNILSVVSNYSPLIELARLHNIKVYKSIKDKNFKKDVEKSDILLCVHGREIIPKSTFRAPRIGSYNVHPYLYKYKGIRPVLRAIKDNCKKGSVGIHEITDKIDYGRIISERFVRCGGKTEVEIYNELYPYYSLVITKLIG